MIFQRRDAETQRKKRSYGIFALIPLCLCVTVVQPALSQTISKNAALLAFKREQIAMIQEELAGNSYYRTDDLQKALKETQARVAEIQQSTGDAAFTKFTLHERTYFAQDGSAQPYWIALPSNYTPRKKWPLIVYLHGYSTDITKLNPWFPPAEIIQAATKRGFILAIPYGRRNSDFVQWGEDDTLKVKSEAIANYSVDTNRVFLSGASMGGYGVYAVGLHDTSQWAAVAPICGRTDFYLFFNIKREDQPVWKRALYDADDPRFLIENTRGTPYFVQHGALDLTVPVEHSRRFIADAKRLGLPIQYREQADGDHWFDFQVSAVNRAFEWFQNVAQQVPSRRTDITAVDLREAKGKWAHIDAFETYGEGATLTAEIGDAAIVVTTKNVARFVLEPPKKFFNAGKMVSVIVNGVEAPKLYDPQLPMIWQEPNAKILKTPDHCGPFKNALRDPFVLVYGNEADRKAALHMAKEWKDDADGDPPLKAASQITDADKANFNLILFGTRETNPLLAQISDQLPIELTPGGYRIGQKNVAGEKLGLRMIWKSPWSPKRLIGICSGFWWGEKMPLNHKWDLIPDYIVYNGEFEADDTNHALEAGFFNGDFGLVEGE